MARIIGTYARFVQEQTRMGKVSVLSHDESVDIDMRISKAFSEAKRKAEVKQRNSIKLLRQLESSKRNLTNRL